MKFGDFIEDHLVSEWRSQYLDYFKGKSKVGKLSAFLETSTGCLCDSSGASQGTTNDYDFNIHTGSNSGLHSSILMRDRYGKGYRMPDTASQHSLDGPTVYDHDEHDDNKAVSLMDKLNYIRTGETTPLLTSTVQHHRSHSTSVLYIKRQESSFKKEDNGIVKLAKQKFFDWVDSELTKVNIFYKYKETECSKRFLILLNQLDKLQEREVEFKNDHMINSSLSQSTPDITANCYHHDQRSKKNRKCLEFKNIVSSDFISNRFYFIFDYFEMPSLPRYFWLQEQQCNNNGLIEYQNRNTTPYKVDATEPPLFISKIMIKKAICELYHKMELLNSFRVVNRTAFRKLIKKYDKKCHDKQLDSYMTKVDSMYFNKSNILNTLTQNVEDVFTNTFENGHRKTAITKLRSFEIEKTHHRSNFLSGYLIGLSCPILIFFILEIFQNSDTKDFINQKYSLQLWGSLFLFILTGLLFSINCVVWDRYKINYKLVFELNPQDALDYKQFLVIPSTLLFIGTLLAYLSYNKSIIELVNFEYFSLIYFYMLLIILFCPLNIFYLKARIWFIASIFRLFLSGFYPVEFRDFFMGVITCSLTYSISNIYMLFCLQNTNWNNCLNCGPMKSYLLGVIACFPPIWRSLQCLRRFLDTGEWFPHFANLLKYLITTSYFFTLSVYRISTFRNPIIEEGIKSTKPITSIFIFISIINSIYSSFWDIFMDWSLMQFNSENYFLRDILIYKRKIFYYFGMIIDIILRFQWVVYVFTPYWISHNPLTAFLVALSELIRRFIWLFFRMENEHASNVNLFRVSRSCAIPYNFSALELIESNKLSEFSKNELHIKINSFFNVINTDNINEQNLATSNINAMSQNNNDMEAFFTNGNEDDINFINEEDDEIASIYSSITQRTQIIKQSNWEQLSRIISNAHTKEFQQRDTQNDGNDSKRMNGINDLKNEDCHEDYDLEEQLDRVEDDEDAILDDEDDDEYEGDDNNVIT